MYSTVLASRADICLLAVLFFLSFPARRSGHTSFCTDKCDLAHFYHPWPTTESDNVPHFPLFRSQVCDVTTWSRLDRFFVTIGDNETSLCSHVESFHLHNRHLADALIQRNVQLFPHNIHLYSCMYTEVTQVKYLQLKGTAAVSYPGIEPATSGPQAQ